jgi:hypothetical protein
LQTFDFASVASEFNFALRSLVCRERIPHLAVEGYWTAGFQAMDE